MSAPIVSSPTVGSESLQTIGRFSAAKSATEMLRKRSALSKVTKTDRLALQLHFLKHFSEELTVLPGEDVGGYTKGIKQ